MKNLGLVIHMAAIIVLFGPLVMLIQIWFDDPSPSVKMTWSINLFVLAWLILVLIWVKAFGRYPTLPKKRLFGAKDYRRTESMEDVKKKIVEDSIRNLKK